MNDRIKQLVAVAALAAIVVLPAHANEPMPPERASGDMVAWDLVLARPIGLLSVIGGSLAFVIALPFTIPSGSTDAAAEQLVKKPINYTFKRPLGQIEQ